MANRTFYLGLKSGQSATVKVYKHTASYASSVGDLTALLSGAALSTTFQSVTMDEDHYLYFVISNAIVSVWGPDRSNSATSGMKVSDVMEADGNYVYDTGYRGIHLDAGNPSGGGSTTTVAPAFTFTLTTDAANSEAAKLYAQYVLHPTGSGSSSSTTSYSATAGSNTSVTLANTKAVGGETLYLNYFKVYNGNKDPGEYSYSYNSDQLAKHPTAASGSMDATGTGTVDYTAPGSSGIVTLTFASGSVKTTAAGGSEYSAGDWCNYQPASSANSSSGYRGIQLPTADGGRRFLLSGTGYAAPGSGYTWTEDTSTIDLTTLSITDWRDVFTAIYNSINGSGDFSSVSKSDPASIAGTGTITITLASGVETTTASSYSKGDKPMLITASGATPFTGGKDRPSTADPVSAAITQAATSTYSWSLVGTTLEQSEDTSMARTKFNAAQIATGSAGGLKGDTSKQLVLDFKDQLANESSVAAAMLIPMQGASSGVVKRASITDIVAAYFGGAVTATHAELNIMDGVTATTAELNIMDGVTSTAAELNILDGVTSTAAELNILDGVTSTAAELNILDGVTSTAAELNILDGVTSTAAELNLIDGSSAGAVVASKAAIHNSAGSLLVTDDAYIGAVGDVDMLQFDGGSEINVASDLDFVIKKTGGLQLADGAVTSTAAELNLLDGVSGLVKADFTKLAGVDASAAELNIMDGVTATTAELNIMDGVTATTAELNIMDGVTSTAAELNILDGVTASTAELNIMDGVTSTATELNLLDGATDANSTASKAVIIDSSGNVTLAGNLTVTGNQIVSQIEVISTSTGVLFEGGTDDGHEATLKSAVAGADTTYTLPNATGYIPLFAADPGTTTISATPAELNILDGVTSTAAELNILDGVTSTAAELNILDGVTSTAAELNILDGVTSTTAELNILDGVTSTAAEINLVDGSSAGAVVASKAAIHNSAGSLLVTDDAYIGAVGDVDMLQFDGGSEINVASDLDFVIKKTGGLQLADGAVTSTAAELNLLDGVSGLVKADFTKLAGVDASAAELNILDGVTSTAAELNILDGVTSTAAELNILDGVTSTAAEINILDGVTATATELNYLDVTTLGTSENSKAVTQKGDGTIVIGATDGNQTIDIASHDLSDGGLKLAGTLVTASAAELNIMDGVTATTAELNIMDGVTSTAAELNIMDGVTASTAELNIMDGVTSTAAELNLVDGSAAGTVANSKAVIYGASGELKGTTLYIGGTLVTSTAAELNILDGVTSTAAELNILDGVTSTAAELNILDGVTSTAAELNILDGVTSTAAELNIMDAGTSASATTLVDADRLVCNDANVGMVQVAMTDISDYMAGRAVQDHFMASADGGATAVGGSTPTASFEVGSSGNPALNSVTLAASTYVALSATPQAIEELQVYLNGQLLVGYHQGSDAAYDYAYSTSIDGSNPGIALKPEGADLGSSGAAIDSDDVLVVKYIKA